MRKYYYTPCGLQPQGVQRKRMPGPLRSLVILERGGRRNSRRASVYHSTAKHDLYSRPGNTVLYGWPRNILRRIYIRLLDGTSDCDPFWASVHDKQKWNQPEPFKWEKLGLLRPARERIAALRQGYPFSLVPPAAASRGGIIVIFSIRNRRDDPMTLAGWKRLVIRKSIQ